MNCNILLHFLSTYNSLEVIILNKKLIISVKSLNGEDGYKTFSIRIKDETVNQLDKLSKATNRSRNELINIILSHGVNNIEIE